MNRRDILRGWLNRHKSDETYVKHRRRICKNCLYNTKTRRGFLWQLIPAFCSVCKCDIKAKTVLPFVACPLSRWGREITQEQLLEDLKKRFG